MIKKITRIFNRLPWQTKLVLSGSSAIFLTFFLFSFLEYHTVSKWMMNREEMAINRTIKDIATFYKARAETLNRTDIIDSDDFLRNMNDKDQLIRVYDNKGNILVSDKNGNFPVLEPVPTRVSTTDRISIEGKEAIVARYPINGDKFKGTLEVVRHLNNYHKMMSNLFWVMTIFGIAAILFSAISGLILAKQLLRPVRRLARGMKKIKEDGFQGRVEVYKQKDDLTELTNVFNEMMDEIEKSFQAQKQFVEDASHELRTPVSILEGHLSLLNRWGKKDPVILEESLDASLQELSRLKKLINDLLVLTRAENQRVVTAEKSDIVDLVLKIISKLEIIHPDYQFEIKMEKHLPMISIAEHHFEQILIILLDNSIKYSNGNKIISISAVREEGDVIVSVSDQGIGIANEDIPDVFNRFYRVDKARVRENGGTGLGLSIAKQLVIKYNGSILIESKEGIGTKVSISIPIVANKGES
ncbi:two-component system sensor histidine kinase ArlS [Bacillus sp. SLBN-46]|nr:two-component system sensor histidine kinase ArlS [Bacillus sp. SLBN-46]